MTLLTVSTPLQIGTLVIPGRLIKSATHESRADERGFVTDELLEFYEPIARGATPLIITGNSYIHPDAKGVPGELGVDHDDKLPGLTRLTELVHDCGSRIFSQINHCGRQTVKHPDPVSASDVRELSMGTRPRPMRRDEIAATTEHFAAAAERAQRAGFDGVQLHMAHGYLLSQFLTPYTNRRTDDYGGSFDGRSRFAREVVQAVRQRVGPTFPVIAKLNGHDLLTGRAGLDTPALVDIARALEHEGLDAIEISAAHYESGLLTSRGRFERFFEALGDGLFNELPPVRRRALAVLRPALVAYANIAWRYSEGFNLDFARQFTEALSIPVICVGGWQHRDAMHAALNSGGCDAVSAARSFIADPLLFKHIVERGEPAAACTFCNACVAYAGELPIDCFEPRVRAQRDAALRAELGWRPSATAAAELTPQR